MSNCKNCGSENVMIACVHRSNTEELFVVGCGDCSEFTSVQFTTSLTATDKYNILENDWEKFNNDVSDH